MGGSFARTLLPDPVDSATYDAANRQRAFGDKAMAYDANGNLTSITEPSGTTTFTWDARNRLSSLAGPDAGGAFAYDGLGRRAMKTINGAATQYLYDNFDIAEERTAGVALSYVRGPSLDQPLVRASAEFYLTDPLGSTVALADSSGALLTRYFYEPFGQTTVEGLSGANPFQFTGRERDTTLLYYYRQRYYSPTMARFLTEDQVGLIGGINRFRYVDNNPIRFSDPSGLVDPVTLSLAATLAALVTIDIAMNIRIHLDDQGKLTVTIPPPSTFSTGVPLPFVFGFEATVNALDLPFIGPIGIPSHAKILIDPRAVQILVPSAEAADFPHGTTSRFRSGFGPGTSCRKC